MNISPQPLKAPVRETTLEEIRQGLLKDADRPGISFKTAQHYRQLAELISHRISNPL